MNDTLNTQLPPGAEKWGAPTVVRENGEELVCLACKVCATRVFIPISKRDSEVIGLYPECKVCAKTAVKPATKVSLVGYVKGHLTVVEESEDKSQLTLWCDCGNILPDYRRDLFFKSKSDSCGCARVIKKRIVERVPLHDRRRGALTVVGFSHCDEDGTENWQCQCDCGQSCYITRSQFNRKAKTTCGKCYLYTKPDGSKVRLERGSTEAAKVAFKGLYLENETHLYYKKLQASLAKEALLKKRQEEEAKIPRFSNEQVAELLQKAQVPVEPKPEPLRQRPRRGVTLGKLTFISEAGEDRYNIKCTCGNKRQVSADDWHNKTISQCQYCDAVQARNEKLEYEKGAKFGSLKVTGKLSSDEWLVTCECSPNDEMQFNRAQLASGEVTNCGYCSTYKSMAAIEQEVADLYSFMKPNEELLEYRMEAAKQGRVLDPNDPELLRLGAEIKAAGESVVELAYSDSE